MHLYSIFSIISGQVEGERPLWNKMRDTEKQICVRPEEKSQGVTPANETLELHLEPQHTRPASGFIRLDNIKKTKLTKRFGIMSAAFLLNSTGKMLLTVKTLSVS